jgi:Tol biopolymer transport system component
MSTRLAVPRWAFAPVGALLAIALLLAAVSLGLRLRVGSGFGGLPGSAPLDYASGPFGSFVPLTRAFIQNVLGGVIESPGQTAGTVPATVDSAAPITTSSTTPKRVEITHPLTNDDRNAARSIPSVPFTARTNTRRATYESGEPRACGAVSGGSVWYRFTPAHSVGLIANTFGSNYSTTLGAFAGSTIVRCDTDVRGNAIVQFVAQKDVTYFFQIAGPGGGGDLVFNLDPEGVTTLESTTAHGDPADGLSTAPSISGDGRLVAFESAAEDLVPRATHSGTDVFVRDRVRRVNSLVSLSSSGAPGNDTSHGAFVSGNGRFVAFESYASNLVEDDTNGTGDIFVHDRVTRRTERVSVSSSGTEQRPEPVTDWGVGSTDGTQTNGATCGGGLPAQCSNNERMFPTLSYDGRYVAFQSHAPNLVPNDHNHSWDVFVHDRLTGRTERVSVDSSGRERGAESAGVQGAPRNDFAMTPSISGNGRFVAFRTAAGNLVAGDDNRAHDVFVHDRLKRTTERITVAPGPVNVVDEDQPYYPQNELNQRQAFSFDGRYVAFSAAPRPTAGPFEVHIFVHDRKLHRTVQADVSSSGQRAEDGSLTRGPAISADGRYIAFQTDASNLVAGDDNDAVDVFLRDLKTGSTIRLNSAAATEDGPCQDCGSSLPALSADGRVVAFQSSPVNPALVPGVDDQTQIFVNERLGAQR